MLGTFFPAAFQCPHEVERFGALGDGGKWVCGLSRLKEKKDCVVYSFGTFSLPIFFMPPPASWSISLAYQGINYESSFEAAILANTDHCQIWGYDFSVKSFGPEIPESQVHRTHFHAYGLSGADAHGPDDIPPMYTLETLLKMNGARHFCFYAIQVFILPRSPAHRHFENRYRRLGIRNYHVPT